MQVSSSWRRRTKFFSVIEFRREEFSYSGDRANVLRQTDPSPPKTRHRCAFYSQFSTNICGGATTSFSRARCRATMTPFSYDRVLYSARTRSGDARAHTDVTRTRSVSLALSLVARALRLNGTLTHSHTTNNTIVIIIIIAVATRRTTVDRRVRQSFVQTQLARGASVCGVCSAYYGWGKARGVTGGRASAVLPTPDDGGKEKAGKNTPPPTTTLLLLRVLAATALLFLLL